MSETRSQKKPLPTFFLSHGGGPCFWMQWNPPNLFDNLAEFFRGFAAALPERPKAILVISGHWEEANFTVQTSARPSMLYDYSGFPEHTYRLRYPAPGSPELARRVQELLTVANIPVREDGERGFDHGLFVPFMMIYPDADIPIIELSMKNSLDPKAHFDLGRALAPLRSEGVLIVGSGLSYHNLRQIPDRNGVSEEFDTWLTAAVCDPDASSRHEKLTHWEKAPQARRAHPREDHLIPLLVAAGAAGDDAGQRVYSERMPGWNLRASSFKFGD